MENKLLTVEELAVVSHALSCAANTYLSDEGDMKSRAKSAFCKIAKACGISDKVVDFVWSLGDVAYGVENDAT